MSYTADAPPLTPVEPVVDALHGITVVDPYRWLEDQDASRTRKWLDEQSAYTRAYFDSIVRRDVVRQRVNELLAIPPVTEIWHAGKHYFFLKRQEDREQPAIVMRDGLFGQETILVDPVLRTTGTTT